MHAAVFRRRLIRRLDGQFKYWANSCPKYFHSQSSFNHWHHHVDWKSEGNVSPKHRQEELTVLFELHRRLRRRMARYSKPFQLWISICQDDSGQDGVWIQSENPHSDFPAAAVAFKPVPRVPVWLCQHFDPNSQSIARAPGRRIFYFIEDNASLNRHYRRILRTPQVVSHSHKVRRRDLTTASSARVNHKVPSSGVGARGAHAER